MEKTPEKKTHDKTPLTSLNAYAPVEMALETLVKMCHPDRAQLGDLETLMQMATIVEPDPTIVQKAIVKGMTTCGDPFRIDGILVLNWITKYQAELKEEEANARRMGFM